MSDQKWHFDKNIPVVVIFALFMQTLGFTWFLSNMDTRLTGAEQELVHNEVVDSAADENIRSLQRDTVRLSEQLRAIQRTLEKIEAKLAD